MWNLPPQTCTSYFLFYVKTSYYLLFDNQKVYIENGSLWWHLWIVHFFIKLEKHSVITEIKEDILIHRGKNCFYIGVPKVSLHQNHLGYILKSLILSPHLRSANLESGHGAQDSVFLLCWFGDYIYCQILEALSYDLKIDLTSFLQVPGTKADILMNQTHTPKHTGRTNWELGWEPEKSLFFFWVLRSMGHETLCTLRTIKCCGILLQLSFFLSIIRTVNRYEGREFPVAFCSRSYHILYIFLIKKYMMNSTPWFFGGKVKLYSCICFVFTKQAQCAFIHVII